jgi:hypothetical protein
MICLLFLTVRRAPVKAIFRNTHANFLVNQIALIGPPRGALCGAWPAAESSICWSDAPLDQDSEVSQDNQFFKRKYLHCATPEAPCLKQYGDQLSMPSRCPLFLGACTLRGV